MTDDRSSIERIERLVTSGVIVVAPVTVLSALLFYFGYVSSRSQYEYFGIDVDTIGLGTRDYVMRSPQPLLVPLLVLSLIGVGVLALHAGVRRRIAAAVTSAGTSDTATSGTATSGTGAGDGENPGGGVAPTRALEAIGRLARGATAAGAALLGAGIVLLFSYPTVREWALYNLVTPLLTALGAALIAYGSRVRGLVRREQARISPAGPAGPVDGGLGPVQRSELLHRASRLLLYVVLLASIFWITATIAQWSGRGLAQYQAQHLDQLPSVILDTKERLYLRAPGIEETALPAAQGQTFYYRYRNLRLLIHGNDRMFLVPNQWSPSDTTLIVVLDGSVRVQFQFQNQPP